jgi:transporter, stomatin/podocin/band 7/nephrosis.2/SPFH family
MENENKETVTNKDVALSKGSLKIVAGSLCVVTVIILLLTSFYNVDTGQVGIVKRFGKVIAIKEEGLNIKAPLIDKVYKMNVREQTLKFSYEGDNNDAPAISASTKDMQTVLVSVTVSDIVSDPMKLYRAFTGNHVRSMMVPRVKDAVQSQVASYTIEEFIAKRDQLSKDIYNDLENTFAGYGVTLTNVSIIDHDFSDDYEKAVEAKKIAEQQVEEERQKQQKLIVEQENKVKLAELEVEKKKLEAEANKIVTDSLSKEILQKQMIEKWDGKLPYVTGGSDTILSPEMFTR